MIRREVLASLLASTATLFVGAGRAAAAMRRGGKPNIIFVVSDQHRAGMTRDTGFAFDTSPGLDALARRGVRFGHAYCTAPLCVPSRTSMLTGRWPQAHRVRMNLDADAAVYTKDLYDVAKDAGYRTGLAGKNHTYRKAASLDFWREYSHTSGYRPPNSPPSYAAYEHWLHGLGPGSMALEPTPFPIEVQYPYRIVSDAIDFIDGSGGQPFILQVGFPEPHPPEQVPAPYWDMFPPDKLPPRTAGPETLAKLGFRAEWLFDLEQHAAHPDEEHWRRYVSNYLGALRMVDDQLVRLLRHLDRRGIADDTLIVYMADHGDYVMEYGLGRKGVGLSEALTRIPMVFAGAGVKPSHGFDEVFVSNADFMPTLCEAMGQPIPHGVQGRSLWPLLRGEAYPAEEFRSVLSEVGLGGMYYDASDTEIALPPVGSVTSGKGGALALVGDTLNKVTQSGYQRMIRMGQWKLIYDMMGYGQLYDLEHDPAEIRNLFGQPDVAATQARLMAELAMWSIRLEDNLPTGPQNAKYQTKWPGPHNWVTPYRRAPADSAFVP